MAQVTVETVLHLRDFGLERLDEPSSALPTKRKPGWCAGTLLFLVVSGDNESRTFYIYDFYPLTLPIEQRYGGFREEEFQSLTKAFDLVALARNPWVLRR